MKPDLPRAAAASLSLAAFLSTVSVARGRAEQGDRGCEEGGRTHRHRGAASTKSPPAEHYETALFPAIEQQAKAKEVITKQWNVVVGANIQ